MDFMQRALELAQRAQGWCSPNPAVGAVLVKDGKVSEQEEARRLRATGETVPDIAVRLGVSKSSVSLWVR